MDRLDGVDDGRWLPIFALADALPLEAARA